MLRRFIIIIIRRGVGRHSKYELKSDVLYISKEYIYMSITIVIVIIIMRSFTS